jgi:hypothetical protein
MLKLLSLAFTFAFAVSCSYSTSSYFKEKKEIEVFLDDYKKLLQNAKFDSVALLYVDTGFISIGNGNMTIENIDSIKAFYSRFPKVQSEFRWENVRIDILKNDAALVNCHFYWHDKDSPDTTKSSYTGVFLKINNRWKIKNEHESLDFATLSRLIKKSEQKQ